jgi:hypothetical protein
MHFVVPARQVGCPSRVATVELWCGHVAKETNDKAGAFTSPVRDRPYNFCQRPSERYLQKSSGLHCSVS